MISFMRKGNSLCDKNLLHKTEENMQKVSMFLDPSQSARPRRSESVANHLPNLKLQSN